MDLDWKDKLNALRNSFDEPTEPAESIKGNDEIKEEQTQKEKLRVIIDKKGRKGKTATIIEGFTIPQPEVEEIAGELKSKLGCGGSVREGEILIQGDARLKIIEYLKSKGFKIQ